MKTATTLLLLFSIVGPLAMAGCQSGAAREPMAPRPTMTAESPKTAPPPPRMETTRSKGPVTIERKGPSKVIVGKEFSYTITVTNVTEMTLVQVEVGELVDKKFEVTSTSPKGTIKDYLITWNVGKMDPGESRTLTVTGKAVKSGPMRPCVDVTYKFPTLCSDITAVQPALQIAKSGPEEVLYCERIEYTIVVRNTGDGAATNVEVVDQLPDGLVAIVDGKETAKVMARVGTLEPGNSAKITVTAEPRKTGTFENKVVATADNNLRAEATSRTRVRRPMLVVAKTGPAKRFLGLAVTYEITVANKGDGEARNTVLVDTLPRGLVFASATDGGKHSGGKVTWSLGTIAPSAEKKVSVTVKTTALGTMRNSVAATAMCSKGEAEFATEVVGIPAILLEMVDVEDPDLIGTEETYVITVTNQGSADGTNIRIVATVPDEQEYVSSDGPTKATAEGKKVTFAPLARLAPKAAAVYKVTVKSVKTGDVRFKVELTSDQIGTPVMETESTNIYK